MSKKHPTFPEIEEVNIAAVHERIAGAIRRGALPERMKRLAVQDIRIVAEWVYENLI